MGTKKSTARVAVSSDAPQKLGILTNPFARANVVRLPTHDMEQVTQSLSEVPRVIDKLLDAGATALAINGGDGTLGAVIAHLERRKIQVPLVPVLGGTNNSVAKDAHSVGRIDDVLARLRGRDLRALPRIERATLRVARVSHTGKRTELGVGFLFATGLIVRFVDDYYAGPWYGPVQAARVVANRIGRVLLGADAAFWRFEANQIQIDGAALPLPNGAQLTLLSTIDNQILFFKPYNVPASALTGFNVLVNALPSKTIARHLYPLGTGRYSGEGHWTQEAKRFAITGTKQIFVDGELHTVEATDTVEVTPGPRVSFVQI